MDGVPGADDGAVPVGHEDVIAVFEAVGAGAGADAFSPFSRHLGLTNIGSPRFSVNHLKPTRNLYIFPGFFKSDQADIQVRSVHTQDPSPEVLSLILNADKTWGDIACAAKNKRKRPRHCFCCANVDRPENGHPPPNISFLGMNEAHKQREKEVRPNIRTLFSGSELILKSDCDTMNLLASVGREAQSRRYRSRRLSCRIRILRRLRKRKATREESLDHFPVIFEHPSNDHVQILATVGFVQNNPPVRRDQPRIEYTRGKGGDQVPFLLKFRTNAILLLESPVTLPTRLYLHMKILFLFGISLQHKNF
ncbi:hypothetical protein K438DRAFT_1752544 [Mycena galopus ATCC 62051]|nr:hypothetical protein K438DRAFT_1752544 [Mycena galopus ATCC 62051]